VKVLGGKASESIPVISAKDITTVIDMGAEEGFIDEHEKKMMSNVLQFGDMTVKEAMVPRTSVVGIDLTWEVDKILDLVIEDGYSRMPVYKKDMDHIIGLIYTKDMLSMIKNRGLIIFQDLLRAPYFVPETKKLEELLKEFRKGKIHMAVVVDEFGGTSGIITLEDILEEIVGEIQDEYDIEEIDVENLNSTTIIVKGRMEIDKLNAQYRLDVPEEDGVNTVGGFVTALFGRVAKHGESIKFGNMLFTVEKSDARKIEKVRIEITRPAQPQPGETGEDGAKAGKKQAEKEEESEAVSEKPVEK
ncbi:MAG TPA: HlyC/CorC family transporter, partial [bacterium]|nr:HlyC/CorC family transporter [bacterium]